MGVPFVLRAVYKGEKMAAKILVVDDEMHLAKIIQLTLEHAGYEAVLAYDGKEALEMVRRERPALVILDLMLPVLDGYKVCNIIKGDDESKDIRVIILTGRDLSREQIDEPLGADLVIMKPFNSTFLVEKISELLGRNLSF